MRRFLALLLAGLFLIGPGHAQAAEQKKVMVGIDVLEANHFQGLEGKRVGLLTNQSAVDSRGVSTIEVFRHAPNVKLTALYCPEHGLYGATTAGAPVQSSIDVGTGLPIYSLYDDTRKPTPEMLKNIDVMVFDIQDIGSRSYTFISTLGLAMEACAEAGKEFYVLDRPNPLGGDRIEGMPLNPAFRSFVGMWDIPYIHGLTIAELAWMIHQEKWIKARPPLTLVPMRGWRRNMPWEETGLKWVPPSPHIPTVESAFGYAVTGLWGEFPDLNNGVGYTLPFGLIGAVKLDPFPLQKALEARDLDGFAFLPAYYRPYYGSAKDLLLGGVRILYKDPAKANLMQGAMVLMEEVQKAAGHNFFQSLTPEKAAFFDKLCGGDTVRLHFLANKPAQELVDSWEPSLQEFRARRAKYLLYPSNLPLAHPVRPAPVKPQAAWTPPPVPVPTPAPAPAPVPPPEPVAKAHAVLPPPKPVPAPLPVQIPKAQVVAPTAAQPTTTPVPLPVAEPVAKAQAVPERVAKAQAVPAPVVKKAVAVAPAPAPIPPAPAPQIIALPPPTLRPVVVTPPPAPEPAPAPAPPPAMASPTVAPRAAEPTVTIFAPQVMKPQVPLRSATPDTSAPTATNAPATDTTAPVPNPPSTTLEPLPPPPDFIGQ